MYIMSPTSGYIAFALLLYIYILSAFTEKPHDKPLERDVVYTSVITLSHATSHDVT